MHSDWTTITVLRVKVKDPDETIDAALAEFCLTIDALRVKVKDPDVTGHHPRSPITADGRFVNST